jgi:GDP-L-fucose synthase
LVGDTVGYRGNIAFDTSKPDGTPRKLLDVSKLKQLGWQASTPLPEGLRKAYASFVELTEEGADRAAA